MPSPFPCSPVIRECSWKKAHIERKYILKKCICGAKYDVQHALSCKKDGFETETLPY